MQGRHGLMNAQTSRSIATGSRTRMADQAAMSRCGNSSDSSITFRSSAYMYLADMQTKQVVSDLFESDSQLDCSLHLTRTSAWMLAVGGQLMHSNESIITRRSHRHRTVNGLIRRRRTDNICISE